MEKKDVKETKADEAKAENPKDSGPAPVIDGSQNPEGVDLTAGDKDAATAYQED